MKCLFIIPARGGSKGLPKKNIKPLAGKPLICYTLDAALAVTGKEHICVSTDSEVIKKVVEDYGIEVPFIRPAHLAQDHSTTEDVILQAIEHFENKGIYYDHVVLLQPTSPLRRPEHIKQALSQVKESTELLVSVKETDANPYYVLFEENQGILEKSKKGQFTRRQDCPVVYELNGAIYVIAIKALKNKGYQQLKMEKFIMEKEASIDIDDALDFKIAELLLQDG